MVKKYKDLDIAVVSKVCDVKQAERIRKYCKLYIHTNQRIECKVAIINYDTSIIDFINEEAEIYQTIHADYSNEIYDRKPKPHSRIKSYIAITEFLQGKMKEILKVDNIMLSYNPLTIEQEEKPLILVSATRLHKNKGKDRMQRLATALDKAGINYIWYVITGDIGGIESDNIIFIKNRLDVSKWINQADYVVLLSDSEACSYTINEALYRNIPVITTPLPYLKEIGVEDGKNAYIMNFDCSNVNDIVKKIKNIPKFKFNKMEDKYSSIFFNIKSNYEEEKKMKFLVRATEKYKTTNTSDAELSARKGIVNYIPAEGEEWEVEFERKEKLESLGFVTVVKEINSFDETLKNIKETGERIADAIKEEAIEDETIVETTKKKAPRKKK